MSVVGWRIAEPTDATPPGPAQEVAAASLDQDRSEARDLVTLLWRQEPGMHRKRFLAFAGDRPVAVLLGNLRDREAHLDLIAVQPGIRGNGIGRSLLGAWEEWAIASGATELRVGGNMHTYAWPGVDIRYTPAIAMLMRGGYRRSDSAINMDAPLAHLDRRAAHRRLEQAGIVLRRAEARDRAQLAEYAAAKWTDAWQRETLAGCDREPATTFIAVRHEKIVGFSAYGIYRPSWFGPLATDRTAQGLGIGEALMRLCLADMAGAGIRVAQIGWVNDAIPFYAKTVGATLGRCFWMFTKPAPDRDHR